MRPRSEGAYEVTELWRQVREDAETLTDRYFYTPWQTLNDDEVHEMRDLLTRLKTALAQPMEVMTT